jgi:hypothetical protein
MRPVRTLAGATGGQMLAAEGGPWWYVSRHRPDVLKYAFALEPLEADF